MFKIRYNPEGVCPVMIEGMIFDVAAMVVLPSHLFLESPLSATPLQFVYLKHGYSNHYEKERCGQHGVRYIVMIDIASEFMRT